MYSLLIASCDPANPQLTATGNVTVLNPFGYMSGEEHPFLAFYAALSWVYGGLLAVWVGLLGYYKDTTVMMQKWVISSVVLSCFLEAFTYYFEWDVYNSVGTHSALLVVVGILLNSWRSSFSRMLMLAMSMGLGVVRSSLGPETVRIIVFGLFYFLANLVYDLVLYFTQHNQVPKSALMVATLPIALLNAICYYWIFVSLLEVKRLLMVEKQDFKLHMYEKLTNVLVLAGVMTVAFVCGEVFFRATMDRDEYWSFVWLFDAMWHIIFAVIIAAVMFLWRPDSRSQLLQQSEQVRGDDELVEEEKKEIELTKQDAYSKDLYQWRGPHSFSIDD